jgi:hypothetical protein
MGACVPAQIALDPQKYIAAQLSTLLYGWSAPTTGAAPGAPKAKA